jgi:cell wall-associated NlpC family hydrolase
VKKGDIVLNKYGGVPENRILAYIGNGEFIHAANPKRGVVCDNMNTLSYYNERFVTARRIVK